MFNNYLSLFLRPNNDSFCVQSCQSLKIDDHDKTKKYIFAHPCALLPLSCSLPSSKVATSHGDHTIKVFEVKTGKCVASLKGHSRTAWTLCYHPYHNNIIASGSLDGEIKIWDLLVSCVKSSTYNR